MHCLLRLLGLFAQAKERQLTRLYYGTFNPEMTAYKGLAAEWQASGVEVSPQLMENMPIPAAVTLSLTHARSYRCPD